MPTNPTRRRARRAWLAVPIALALVAGACGGDDDDDTTETTGGATDEDAIVFGALLPQTGPLSELAQAQSTAIQLALDDIADAGGLLGRETRLAAVDSTSRADLAPAAAQTVLQQGANTVVGPIASSVALAVQPVFDEAGVPACSPAATSPALNPVAGEQDLFYRLSLPSNIYARELSTVLADAGKTNVSIVARADEYGNSISEYLRQDLAGRGIAATVVTYAPPAANAPLDAAAVVGQAAAPGPDAVVLATFAEGVDIVAAALDAGVPASAMYGLEAFANLGLPQAIGDPAAVEGFNVFAPSGQREFFTRMLDAQSGREGFLVYSPEAYDCAILMALAMERAGSALPGNYVAEIEAVASGGEPCSSFADCQTRLRADEDVYYAGVSNATPLSPEGQATRGTYSLATYDATGNLGEVTSVTVNLTAEEITAQIDADRQQAVTVSSIQTALTILGYYDGPINGVWDEATENAVKALQTDLGLEPTGVWDEATSAAVQAELDKRNQLSSTYVTELQVLLTSLGVYSGPIDGVYSPAVTDAITALQAELGVEQTGVMDNATWAALGARQAASTTTTAAPTTTAAAAPTVVNVISDNPQLFSTLLTLATGAAGTDPEILAVLTGPGPVTLFAPTNSSLTPDLVAKIQALPPETQAQVLRYHIVQENLPASALASQDYPTFLAGQNVTVTVGDDGSVTLTDGAGQTIPVTQADVPLASGAQPGNGVVHAIGGVLLPPGVTLP